MEVGVAVVHPAPRTVDIWTSIAADDICSAGEGTKQPLKALSDTTFAPGTDEITFVRSSTGEGRELILITDVPASRATVYEIGTQAGTTVQRHRVHRRRKPSTIWVGGGLDLRKVLDIGTQDASALAMAHEAASLINPRTS